MLTLAVMVAVAVFAAGWTAMNRRTRRPVLPYRHVAGVAIVALLGWEAIVYLPGAIVGYFALTAGLGDVSGVEADEAFVAALAIFAVAAVLAVVGVLQRRAWGVALAIGLAAARLATSLAAVAQTLVLFGDAQVVGDWSYVTMTATSIALQSVPPLAAIVLLAWPLLEDRARPESVSMITDEVPEWQGGASPVDPAR
jgi:hypothetical protein